MVLADIAPEEIEEILHQGLSFDAFYRDIPSLRHDKTLIKDFEILLTQFKGYSYWSPLLVSDMHHYLNAYKAADILEKQPELLSELRSYAKRESAKFECAQKLSKILDTSNPLKNLLTALTNPFDHQELLSGFPVTLLAPQAQWKGRRKLVYALCPDLIFNKQSLQQLKSEFHV